MEKLNIFFLILSFTCRSVYSQSILDATKQLNTALNNVDLLGVQNAISSGADVNQGDGALIYFLKNGPIRDNLEIVLTLIKANVNVKKPDGFGLTALMWASRFGYTDSTRAILNAGADKNVQDYNGMTALMWACVDGYDVTIGVLVNAGNINLDLQDNKNRTALIIASEQGYVLSINELINAGANVNIQNNNGQTALILASQNNYIDVVTALVNAKANILIKDNNGETALTLANNQQITKALTVKATNAKTTLGPMAQRAQFLKNAILSGNKEDIQSAVNYYIQISANFNSGMGTLIYWLKNGPDVDEASICQMLIEDGVSVNNTDSFLQTALMWAARYGYPNSSQVIINYGAPLNARDINGKTALMIAAEYGRSNPVVNVLINAKADLNVQDNNGLTALMIASEIGYSLTVKALIDAGADLNIKNNDGKTALDLATESGSIFIIPLLKAAMGINTTPKSNLCSRAH